jgi:hypothetical protein
MELLILLRTPGSDVTTWQEQTMRRITSLQVLALAQLHNATYTFTCRHSGQTLAPVTVANLPDAASTPPNANNIKHWNHYDIRSKVLHGVSKAW